MRAEVVAGDMLPLVAQYLLDKTEVELTPGMFQAFAFIADDGTFCGAVAVHNWRRVDCEVVLAAETALAFRPIICEVFFNYIFNVVGCARCTAVTVKRNKRARRFIEHIGFKLEGTLRRAIDGRRDALIYGLLVDDCKYLKRAGGLVEQKGRFSSAAAA